MELLENSFGIVNGNIVGEAVIPVKAVVGGEGLNAPPNLTYQYIIKMKNDKSLTKLMAAFRLDEGKLKGIGSSLFRRLR
ncbi:hypothetical protein Csa_016841 [Cucumis sativus]|uniref:Uncharacterized protein n=1 Tax=Cucumis sativus TaxID=3659 RepID=A0A0A0K631_CUCSA|nr:hypothetical protein Csa_016841 [Cucumis sativus]